jgi:CspA family cold shock protein
VDVISNKDRRWIISFKKRETGIVKRYDTKEGYGFITRDKGGELFVHYSAIRDRDFCALTIGGRVEFIVITSHKGPQAQDVKCI